MPIWKNRTNLWALALLLAVPCLGAAIQHGFLSELDYIISDRLSLRGEAADRWWANLLQAVTYLGHFGPRSVITLILAVAVYQWRGQLAALVFAITPFAASGYSSALKSVYLRPRPDLITHLDQVSSASYPSGHATGAMVVYGMLLLAVPERWRAAAVILAAVMIGLTAISRISLGVHWATDIVGGTMGGLGFILLARPYIQGATR